MTETECNAVRALERNGRVSCADLIDAAKDPGHPCHHRFTWDIQQAALERWHDQARAIIRSVKFQVLEDTEITTPVCQYIPSPDSEPSFVSLPKIRKQADMRNALWAELAQLHGIASRVYGIAVAKERLVGSGVVSQIRTLRDLAAAIKQELS